MAWTSVGSLGAAAGPKTGLFQQDFSFTRDVDAGAVVVMWVAWDNVWSIFTPREDIIRLWDSVGNWWSRLADQSWHACFAECGPMISVFITQVRYPIPAGATISAVVNYGGAPGLLKCRMASAWEFALPEGYGWAATGQEATGFLESGSGVALGWDPSDTQEYLYIYGMASEGPSTDSFTLPTGFTPIDYVGTTGGAADENVSLWGGWKIASGSGITVDANLSPDRDLVQVVTGVFPVFKSTTFPRTPIIDDFNRGDEDPLDGSIWAAGFDESGPNESQTTGPSSPGTRLLQLISNEAAAGPTDAGGQATVEEYVCDDMEVYATITNFPDDFVGSTHLFIHHQGQTDDADASGWGLSLGRVNNPFPPADWYALRLGRQGNQGLPATTTIWFEMHPDFGPQPGDVWKLGIQRVRKMNHLWLDTGGGWEWIAARRALGGNTSGRLGLAIWDPETRVDDFGGGPTCYIAGINYRYAERHAHVKRLHVNPSDVRNV